MPQTQTVQNNFKEGLKTEFTGLNFPENAATDTQNCVFTLIGDTFRREGINYENNAILNSIGGFANAAYNTYKWKNVGGDGLTEILVVQIGFALHFYRTSTATQVSPVSAQLLQTFVDLSLFTAPGTVVNPFVTECQFTDGNGYLFVFHPNLDPFYCTYNSVDSSITPNKITIQIRDFVGIPEPNVADNFRPSSLSSEHTYNLTNQGWTAGSPWSAQGINAVNPSTWNWPCVGNTVTININSQTNTSSVTNGSTVQFQGAAAGVGGAPHNNFTATATGTVVNYVTPFTSISINITAINYNCSTTAAGFWSGGNFFATPGETLTLSLVNTGFINTWLAAIGNFPSNSDIWWLYKNTSQIFSPSTQFTSVQQNVGAAPKGTYILEAFRQLRSSVSQVNGLTDIITSARPSNGAWFQGRVFYTGVNASFQPTGDAPYTTWTENIYFSQIVTNPTQFGKCYQVNDPTSQNLFSILPTDGGVITIQGSGTIYKLFALENGLLVFAANGIWFITGSQGIGFSAEDFTVRKIANIQNISSTSFINVNGFPMFWNEEGIYYVEPSKQGTGIGQNAMSFEVNNLCLGTILTFYQNIPKQSKKFVRGDYNSVDYIVEWCYRSTVETSVIDRYNFDTILNFNVVNKAFYPYTLPTTSLSNSNLPRIYDVKFIQNPGGSLAPSPVFKYFTFVNHSGTGLFTFSEENDSSFVDWRSEDGIGANFISYFITGYMLPGQALRKIQVPIIYVFSRNPVNNAYIIQAIWDYAGDNFSGKFSTKQVITNSQTDYTMLYRKIRLRGRGIAVQIKIQSVTGQPFDLMGWSVLDNINQAV